MTTYTGMMSEDLTTPRPIDARGLGCPLPSLKLRKAVLSCPVGTPVLLLATDPMARVDVPHLCRDMGWDCQAVESADDIRFMVTRQHKP